MNIEKVFKAIIGFCLGFLNITIYFLPISLQLTIVSILLSIFIYIKISQKINNKKKKVVND